VLEVSFQELPANPDTSELVVDDKQSDLSL
jgi:hypothetical protein